MALRAVAALLFLLGSATALLVRKPLRDRDWYPYPDADLAPNELFDIDDEFVRAPEFKKWVPESLQSSFRSSAHLNYTSWLTSGTPSEQSLKSAFSNSSAVQQRVQWRCKPEVTETCRWQAEDVLLCKALDMAGWYHELGKDDSLEDIINASFQPAVITERSSAAMKVSTSHRFAIISKFKQRHEEGVPHEEPTGHFERMKNKVVNGDSFQTLIDQTCNEDMIEWRPNCVYHAHRGLWCQSMMIAADTNVGTQNLIPRLEGMLALNDDAVKMLDNPYFRGLEQSHREVFEQAATMTKDDWLESGGEDMLALKESWSEWTPVQEKAKKQCKFHRYNNVNSECVWKRTDYMFLQFLEKVGDKVATDPKGFYLAPASPEEVQKLEDVIIQIIGEGGVDWKLRQKMMAKWSEEVDISHRGNQHTMEFREMRKRIQASQKFQELVEKTCWAINHPRPGCWDKAPHDLFYTVVAQAACKLWGAENVYKKLVYRWNE